jgi:hypothetical protein
MANAANLTGTLDEFNAQITTDVNYLTANKVRLVISATNITALNLQYTNPGTGVPQSQLGWLELYNLHSNTDTNTQTITNLVGIRRKQIEATVKTICGDIPNSVLTPNDRSALIWPVSKTTRTTHKVATTNLITFKSVGLGGGDVKTRCFPSGGAINNPTAATQRSTKKSGKQRAARPHKEKGYEIRRSYMLIKQGAAQPTDPNAAGMTMEVITKANSVKHYGTANEGMVLCEFLQWYNPKHPELAGPWSSMQTTLIS